MLIDPNALSYWINHFYGYGSWNAPIWFVALEDGGGNVPEEVADKLSFFSNTHGQVTGPTLSDLREMYRHLVFRFERSKADEFTNLYEYRFGNDAKLHWLWKNLIAFVHGYRNEELADVLAYQKNSFVLQSTPNETLIRLYPLPNPHHHAWYYGWLDMPQFPFLKSRALYQEHVYENRMRTLLHSIATYKPEVVLMYGMENINKLKKPMQESFPESKFKIAKAIKQQIPQHHRADLNGTTMIITTQIPALRHGRIETGFDWEEFGRAVKL